jgi:signal transduction histidine kinase
VNTFKARLLVALVGVVALGALLTAVLTRVLVGYHTAAGDDAPRSRTLVIDHLLSLVTNSVVLAALAAVAAAVLVGIALSRWLARPLERLADTARRFGNGNYEARAHARGPVEVRAAAEAFNEMAGALAQVEARRKELVANLAHELRTPLTSVSGYLQGLLDGVFTPDEDTFAPMLAETQRLVHLVEDLRRLARAEAADLPLDVVAISIPELLAPLLTTLRPNLTQKELALTVDVPPTVPTVAVDVDWARTLVRNLLDNAVRYTPPSGRLAVRVRSAGEFVELDVADTGIGIDEEDLRHVFERFYRADRARSCGAGTGIGLAVAKEIAERHGGRIRAASQPGHGSTFTVSLPLAGHDATVGATQSPHNDAPTSNQRTRLSPESPRCARRGA